MPMLMIRCAFRSDLCPCRASLFFECYCIDGECEKTPQVLDDVSYVNLEDVFDKGHSECDSWAI